jgi:ubiquinone/menaquinone biosynthesis C-methylase UbiE
MLNNIFKVELIDGGEINSAYKGIMFPLSDLKSLPKGITSQFLEYAEDYDKKYNNLRYFRFLLEQAFPVSEIDRQKPYNILDLGAGSGNTTLPLLEMFPVATIIATDLSPDLLAILRAGLSSQPDLLSRTSFICVDAMRDYLSEGIFDIVVGGAILHHLKSPKDALRMVYRTLQPGGIGLFFEPFENGNGLLRYVYERILADPRASLIAPNVTECLKRLCLDFKVRTGSDKSDPIFDLIDDKWLFTKTYIERVCQELGFSSISIQALHQPDKALRRQTEVYLKLAANAKPVELPEWCWHFIEELDSAFSADAKQDLLIEGRVVIRKGALKRL